MSEEKQSIKSIEVRTHYLEDNPKKTVQEHIRRNGERFYTGVARVDFPPTHPNMPPERGVPMNFKFPADVKDVDMAFIRFDEIGKVEYQKELDRRVEMMENMRKGIHLPNGSVAPAKKG